MLNALPSGRKSLRPLNYYYIGLVIPEEGSSYCHEIRQDYFLCSQEPENSSCS